MTTSITLIAGREKSLLRRHPWVFSRAVDKVQGQPNAGDTVEILSQKGQWLGRGFYSPQSQIRARVWTFDQNEAVDEAFFLRRLKRAKASRQPMITEQGLTG